MDDTGLMAIKPRPGSTTTLNAFHRHRGQVDLRPRLDLQQVARRAPPRPLRPALRHAMHRAQNLGHPHPVSRAFGWPAHKERHQDKTVDEHATVPCRDWHGNRETRTRKVLQQRTFPCQIRIGAFAEPSNHSLAVDPNAPHIIGHTARQRRDPRGVRAPG